MLGVRALMAAVVLAGLTCAQDRVFFPTLDGWTIHADLYGTGNRCVVLAHGGRFEKGSWEKQARGLANQQDGSTLSLDYVYKRTTPGSGFVATWESTSEQMNSVVEFQIEPYQGDGLTFVTPAAHQTLNLIFDGKDHPNAGPDVPAGSAYSARRLNERTLEITDKIKDKVTNTQLIELSHDLKTLTQTAHPR